MAKFKIAICLLLLSAFAATSCGEKDDPQPDPPYDPITLLYHETVGIPFDNNTKRIQLMCGNLSLPIRIVGGDGVYELTNNTPQLLEYTLDGDVFTIAPVAEGEGSISIEDQSGNSYTLMVDVIKSSTPQVDGRFYTYAYIETDGMDPKKKTELEQKIIADAPEGVWDFGMSVIIEGERSIAKRYLTLDEDSEYREYNCVCKRDYPASEKAFWLPTQILTWLTMKSDDEEFVLYLCQPIVFDDGRIIRGYNLVINVTDRYINEYPEIKGAYEIQSGYRQPDFE